MVAAMACSGRCSSRRPANRGLFRDGGREVSREFGVDEPSRPESSTAVSESESLTASELSRMAGGGRSILVSGCVEADSCRGEFKGERIRYRWPEAVIVQSNLWSRVQRNRKDRNIVYIRD